jgi:AcrR family transcriptional regulator
MPTSTTIPSSVPTRRERQRQATYDEIVAVSRQLLREGQDVSLRAIATEMGLTAPALYRYVDSHAELMALLARAIFADVVAEMTVARDRHPLDDPAAQIVAAVAAFRRWALGNREEFRLVFASPPTPETQALVDSAAQRPITTLEGCVPEELGAHEFSAFFSDIFGRLWMKYRFPMPADDELPEGVLEALTAPPDDAIDGPAAGPDKLPTVDGVTPGMLWVFERSWARLYGTVTLEVFGHVHPGLITTGALFEATMVDIGADVGLADEWERLRAIVRG